MADARQSDIERIKALLRAEDFAAALPLIDALLAQRPADAGLRWHRTRCLEAQERHQEARAEVEQVLALKPDYAPAWVKRAELAAMTEEAYPRFEADIRKALSLNPQLARAHFQMALLLYRREELPGAQASLVRAIELDPADPEPLLMRSRWSESAAFTVAEGEEGVPQLSGMSLSRPKLEAALADLSRVIELRPADDNPRIRRANLLHQLHRYDEALADYDAVLARLPSDDFKRTFVLELRARSEGQGAGEREEMARLLESGTEREDDSRIKRVDEALAESVIRSAAAAIRHGKSVEEAITELAVDDPDELIALNVAESIFRMGREPEPRYVPVQAGDFSSDQRRFAQRAWKSLAGLGFELLGDFEPEHLRPTLSRRTLLRVGRGGESQIAAASFCIVPNWPGWIAFLLMFITRKWRRAEVIDLETGFDDGVFLITNNTGNVSPFVYGDALQTQALPLGTDADTLVNRHRERVAAYLSAHPRTRALPVGDFDQMQALQRSVTAAKNNYRQSIGYVLDEELRSLLGVRYDSLGPKVRRKLELLADQAA